MPKHHGPLRGPVGINVDEQVAGLRHEALGRLVEKRGHQQKLPVRQFELPARLHDPARAENHPLPALRERSTDHRPLLEGCLHGDCYLAGGRTNTPSAVSWITGIASFGSKTP